MCDPITVVLYLICFNFVLIMGSESIFCELRHSEKFLVCVAISYVLFINFLTIIQLVAKLL